jgi:CDP-4-dehydro-6-deoxyglucose reductase
MSSSLTPGEFSVRIEPHARTLRVTAAQPLLEAALAAGLNLPHSCKSGHCASCRARLVSGEVRYPGARPLGITADEERAGYILLCQARAASDLTVEARLVASVADVEIKTLPCRIEALNPLAPDVMQVLLRLPSVERLPFHAGQYLDVLMDGGKRRSFSIASPPHDSEFLELHVRKVAGGGFTERLFGGGAGTDALRVGSLLRIEGPVGQFSYRDGTAPVIMIAGGTGFAPLKSMLRHALETGGERRIHLYWGARHPRDVYENERVLDWVRRYPHLSFTVVLSQAGAAEAGHTRTGWVHEAVLQDYPDLTGFEVYAAGPPAMIEAIRAGFFRHGLAPDSLHFDSFDYAPDRSAAAPG